MLVLFIITLSAFIQGLTSFGFSLIALPLLAGLLPFQQVIAMLIIYSLMLNLVMLFKLYRNVHLKLITMLIVGGVLGIPLGIWLLQHAEPILLKRIAGLLIIIVSLALLSGKRIVLKNPHKFYAPLGFLSGILQGSLSLSGPPIVLFLSNQDVDKAVFRANLTAFFTMMNLISIPGFVLKGMITGEVLVQTFTALPVLLIGLGGGMYLATRIDEAIFKRITLGLITLAGVMALVSK